MIIHGYTMSNGDEVPVLPDALNSLAAVCDHICVVDGSLGGGTLNQHPEHTEPLKEWLQRDLDSFGLFGVGMYQRWLDVPLTLWQNEFKTPGDQRNWILNRMSGDMAKPDWIVWLDSDEVFSNEFIAGIRPFLESLSPDVTNVCPKWFTLIQDEQHYAPALSTWLSHARIHHPGAVHWSDSWHESMSYVGRRVNFDAHVIHTRQAYRRRLYLQRGHSVVNEGAWACVTAEPVPAGVTWNLHWPENEPIGVPYDADIRNYIEVDK